MKYFFFAIALWVVISCNEATTNNAISITYTVEAFDVAANKMQVTLDIENTSPIHFKAGEWQLHWTQMSGIVNTESLPEGIDFEWVNGAHYTIFSFADQWELPPGEKIHFSYTHNGIMQRLITGPQGAFLVQEGKTHPAEIAIEWEEAKGLADLKIPSAKDRFNTYGENPLLDKSRLNWVVPSPVSQSTPSEFRTPDTEWIISLEPAFASRQEDLGQFLKSSFDVKTSWGIADTNLNITHNSKIAAEGYTLSIGEKTIRLEAANYGGVVYGLQSLRQIITTAEVEQVPWPIIKIEDAPRFQYRGFLLDISRNYYGPEKIKQLLDVMSLFKLNALDFKLADDEGWRIEIPGLEELTAVGSKRGYTTTESDRLIPMYGSGADGGATGNGFISREEFIDVLQYAHARNIQIMPQLSFPSHARAAIKAMNARYEKYKAQGNLEAAEEYLLIDPEDQSTYRSAQLYDDNIICICRESAYTFFEKVVQEMASMYEAAAVPLQQFSIGADELPYGSWRKSPLCDSFIKNNTLGITSIDALYEYNLKRLKGMFDTIGVRMAGWEDIMLDHSEKSQSETQIRKETFNFEVIPYVWNNTWRGGREDMIYKFANLGFQTVMSNSSAFYLDMTDDRDMENYGLAWSGYVDYSDAWGTDPVDVFANQSLTKKHGITPEYIAKTTRLQPDKRKNLIGIQSQLWTETVVSSAVLDELVFPNLIVFAERAWQQRPHWMTLKNFDEQKEAMDRAWNKFSNHIGQRALPLLNALYPSIAYDLPKPGAQILENTLEVRQKFPGLEVRYTTDGTLPTATSTLYEGPITISPNASVRLRAFDRNGRGGRSIQVD